MTHPTPQLASIYGQGKWILVAEVAAAVTGQVAWLRRCGGEPVLVIAATEGVGALPEAVPVHYTRTHGETVMTGLRSFFAFVSRPSGELLRAIRTADPDAAARVIASPLATFDEVAGRPVYGVRRPEWLALEDKTIVDDLWDRAGVARAPSWIGPVAQAPAAAGALRGDLGTVWVADNTEGWHGGGDYTRWVRDDDDTAAAVDWFEVHAERVRVMPFLDGIPCSIHGYSTGDGIATFRPVEMVVFRRLAPPGFVYAGPSTFWDPPPEVREGMRAAALAVARVLQRTVGYRGAFSIDGVCTSEGFRPTELNPRFAGGLERQARVSAVDFGELDRAIVAGDVHVDARWLEGEIVSAADATRVGGLGLPVAGTLPPMEVAVRFRDSRATVAESSQTAVGRIDVGPIVSGSYVRMALDPARVRPGPSVAPLALQAAMLASELWGFDLPHLEVAPDLC